MDLRPSWFAPFSDASQVARILHTIIKAADMKLEKHKQIGILVENVSSGM